MAVALARLLEIEIVGCDALQVYRGFDVATAKPTAEERTAAPHHLVDCVDPGVDYSVADYVRDAERAIAEIAGRGRVAVVVGGTGMYLRGLLRGVVHAPARDPALRERLRRIAERRGPSSLHGMLTARDPQAAARIAPRDVQRVVRALEVACAGDEPLGERIRRDGTWQAGHERYDACKFGLALDRAELVTRLDARVDRFFEAGLVAEVRHLLAAGVPPDANAFKAIGYREVLDALRQGHDPADVVDRVRVRTRQFAKRQMTWYRRERDIAWLPAGDDPANLANRIATSWRSTSDAT